jgi:hypothetical protein
MKDPGLFLNLIQGSGTDLEILNRAVVRSGMSQDELKMAIESLRIFREKASQKIIHITDQWIGGAVDG